MQTGRARLGAGEDGTADQKGGTRLCGGEQGADHEVDAQQRAVVAGADAAEQRVAQRQAAQHNQPAAAGSTKNVSCIARTTHETRGSEVDVSLGLVCYRMRGKKLLHMGQETLLIGYRIKRQLDSLLGATRIVLRGVTSHMLACTRRQRRQLRHLGTATQNCNLLKERLDRGSKPTRAPLQRELQPHLQGL